MQLLLRRVRPRVKWRRDDVASFSNPPAIERHEAAELRQSLLLHFKYEKYQGCVASLEISAVSGLFELLVRSKVGGKDG